MRALIGASPLTHSSSFLVFHLFVTENVIRMRERPSFYVGKCITMAFTVSIKYQYKLGSKIICFNRTIQYRLALES